MIKISKEKIHEIAGMLASSSMCYYNFETEEIIEVPDPEKTDDEIMGMWVDVFKFIRKERKKLIEFCALDSYEQFGIMKNFANSVDDVKFQSKLFYALQHSKPFRNFRDIVDFAVNYRQKWYDFRQKAYEEYVKMVLDGYNFEEFGVTDDVEDNFDYVTKMDVRFAHLEKIDVPLIVEECKDKWYNETLTEVNSSFVRLGIVEGEYHWHKHDEDDEFFFILEGQLLIDLEDRTIELNPLQGVTIPKGTPHRPRAPIKTVMLMLETNEIRPTGD